MHYYNEFDPYAAAWLRVLMAEGAIPVGVVDERDIREVQADELLQYVQCHFFAGIGGWALALRLAGWPEDQAAWTASCPCPPFSSAGQKKSCPQCKGQDLVPHPYRTGFFVCCSCQHEWHADERHLWPEVLRLVEKCRPPVLFGEQVASADGRVWLAGVRATLEILGHGVGATDFCAAGVRSPQIRQRLYWVAESESQRRDGRQFARGRRPGSSDGGESGRVAVAEGAGPSAGEHAGEAGGEEGPGPRLRGTRGHGSNGGMADTGCVADERRGESRTASGTAGPAEGERDQRERRRETAGDRVTDRGLASADGEGRAPREWRRSGEPERDSEHGGGTSGLDNAGRERTEQSGAPEPRRDGSDDRISRPPSPQSDAERMGEPVGARLEGHTGDGDGSSESGRVGSEEVGSTAETGDAGRLVDAAGGRARSEEQQRREHGGECTGSTGFWDDWIWHACTDGKLRRIPSEPAFFPLAHGIPGRVAMLKGFGNAIVPPQAAEFIAAYIETLKH